MSKNNSTRIQLQNGYHVRVVLLIVLSCFCTGCWKKKVAEKVDKQTIDETPTQLDKLIDRVVDQSYIPSEVEETFKNNAAKLYPFVKSYLTDNSNDANRRAFFDPVCRTIT